MRPLPCSICTLMRRNLPSCFWFFDLARASEAQIVAVDNHPPFVSQLARRAAECGLGAQITAQVNDMIDLPFPDGSFHVMFEGSIFIIGFAKGLSSWRRDDPG